MRLWMAFLALLPACGFQAPMASGDGGGIDSRPDAPQLCFGTFTRVCFNTLADVPTDAKNLSTGADIDTDSPVQAMCDQHNDRTNDFCVIAGKGFVLPANQMIRAHGGKPLVLLSTDAMTLEALSLVDVSSTHMPASPGAGANPSSCVNGMPPMMAGGGYGGSFGGKGGDGERLGGAPMTSGNAAPAVTPAPTMLRGGCDGGDGDSTGGAGGAGGGAVALIATTSIQLLGTVNASGAGGHGGPASKSGGGGGGSGGMIVIESMSMSITATGPLFANGGGGGQGGTGGGSPVPGVDGGESNAPGTPAIAGTSGAEGGNGGVGSSGPGKPNGANPPNNVSGMGGGGGAGGGAGFIRGHGLPVMANIFPNAIDLP